VAKKDYYALLNIPRSASDEDIKKAYRKLAVKYHPDKNPNDKNAEEKFKEATEAYRVLSDPQQRKMYDQFGHAGAQAGASGGGTAGSQGAPFEDFASYAGFGKDFGGFSSRGPWSEGVGGFQDIFSDLFGDAFQSYGDRTRRGFKQRGTDLRYNLSISFEEAALGCERVIQFKRNRKGAQELARLSVKVPPGVDNQQRLKLRGEGDSSPGGGPLGDRYGIVNIQPHPLFTKHKEDIHLELPISFVDAALGTEVQMPTLRGKASLRIPPRTTTRKSLRLRGKGLAKKDSPGHGDMIVKIIVDVPDNFTKQEKEQLEQLKTSARKSKKVKEYNKQMDRLLKQRNK